MVTPRLGLDIPEIGLDGPEYAQMVGDAFAALDEALFVWVDGFGAVGDGSVDDSQAILDAIEYIEEQKISGNSGIWGASSIHSGTQPILAFTPGKLYRHDEPIPLVNYHRVWGRGAALVAPDDVDHFTEIRYDFLCEGLKFRRGHHTFGVSTDNVGAATIGIRDVEVIEPQGTVVKDDGGALSRSTALRWSGGRIIANTTPGVVAYDAGFDLAHFDGLWINAGGTSAFKTNRGVLHLDGILGVPQNATGEWVHLDGGSVLIDGMSRLGGEGGGKLAIKCDTAMDIDAAPDMTFCKVRDSKIYGPAVAEFYALPNIIEFVGNSGFTGTEGILFDSTISADDRAQFAVTGRFTIDGNQADIALTGAGLSDPDVLAMVLTGKPPAVAGYIGVDELARSLEASDSSYGRAISQSNTTSNAPTGLFGQTMTEVTATADAAFWQRTYSSALTGLDDTTYTATFEVDVTNYPVTVRLSTAQHVEYLTLPVGRHILSHSFPYIDGTSGTQVTCRIEDMKSGTIVRVGTYRVLKGVHRLTTPNIVAYGTAVPTVGKWLDGDRVINSQPAAAGAPEWVCTTTGTPGTWKAYGVVAA